VLNITILLLVSDSVIRSVICKALESEGYSVLTAGDVGLAVDWLKRCTPDLLIVRHYTKSVSGHDAALYLRTIFPSIPILILGGLLDDGRVDNREELQGFEIFPRRYKAAELLDKVKEVLLKCPPRNQIARDPE